MSLSATNIASPTTSLDNYFRCPQCPQNRPFKGSRGLKIHFAKVHKTCIPSSAPVTSITTPFQQPQSPGSDLPFWQIISNLKNTFPILKRIPRGARISVCKNLAETIKTTISENSKRSWEHLLTFSYRVLHINPNDQSRKSLTNKIKENCSSNHSLHSLSFNKKQYAPKNSAFKVVENKAGDGDIRGAARLLFSNDVVAPNNPATLAALLSKHPPPAASSFLPDPPDPLDPSLQASAQDVLGAIMSFPNGSSGGLDGLTPQHLKDLLSLGCGDARDELLKTLTDLVNVMLAGQVPSDVIDILYGANLCALLKKDGGIRPIAVGTTFRRLAAKITCRANLEKLGREFTPVQLGFGSKSGCEAAVHAVRGFLEGQGGDVLLKVDVTNAFNSVHRGAMLTQIKEKIPLSYKFLWQCYSSSSKLLYKTNLLASSVGCQQGDPMGPAIFSLAIHPIIKTLNSKLNVWYLDDGTLGGEADTVLSDLQTLTTALSTIGLSLNFSKCELFVQSTCIDKDTIIDNFKKNAPGINIVDENTLHLLGCPVLDQSFNQFIDSKIQNFSSVSDRLLKINMHTAFTIIRHCLFVPKFTYVLRCSHLWKHPSLLTNLDNLIEQTLSKILNVSFTERSWTQASLPIRFGGLGIRKLSSVSLPAFLSSVHCAQSLIGEILAPSLGSPEAAHCSEAQNVWALTCPNTDPPPNPCSQRQWDEPLCRLVRNNLLQTSTSPADRARLLATAEWESGLWLQTLPSPTIGTLLDNNTFRLATSLRIGTVTNVPHRCQCGTMVDSLGQHGLSCGKSAGRIPRHAAINDIIRRTLVSVKVPAVLEPVGLARDDGKRPDGMTLVPWRMGRPLVWDATCVDTLAPSHLPSTSVNAGSAASCAEDLKRRKYASLGSGYLFEAFGVETLGPWGPSARRLYRDLSARLIDTSGDQRAGLYFAQRVSIAIQRGNAASLLGTLPSDGDLGQIFYL